MLLTVVFWLYLVNSILLINHEIDSAYWKEWELFNIPGGIGGFLIFHFPVLFIFLYGLVLIGQGTMAGLIISLLLSITGIGAFFIHNYFFSKGHQQFKTPMSIGILISTLCVSLVQLPLTILLMIK
jgi:Family of unknown function (DUF6713)